MSEFENELKLHVEEVEQILKEMFPEQKQTYYKRVMDAMAYSYFSGGKRLRPMMMLESFRLFGGTDTEVVKPYMAALEMIHTYSLIHDDLPAMDNDDYRRGRLTNHKQFDEATAILAGDGLLNYAFQLVSFSMISEKDTEMLKRKAKSFYALADYAGVFGMIGGQMADIEAEKKEQSTREEILFIHENKTAALMKAALEIGAILAGADEENVVKMTRIGENVGLAFQIQDDILDCIGDEALLGKPVGSDARNQKTTYVTLEGLEKAKKDQEQLSKDAIELFDTLSGQNAFLRNLIMSLVERKY